MSARLERSFWSASPLRRIPFLDELRELILDGPSAPRRMPKWRLRVAPDLVLEIQPKDAARLRFAGWAIEGDTVTAQLFTSPRHARAWDRRGELRFIIVQPPTAEAWDFHPRSADMCSRAADGQWIRADPRPLRLRVFEALDEFADRDINALSLLSDHCVCCGKALTDPVSRARKIGPECAGRRPGVPMVPLTGARP